MSASIVGLILVVIYLAICVVVIRRIERRVYHLENHVAFQMASMGTDLDSAHKSISNLYRIPNEHEARLVRLETEIAEHLIAKHSMGPDATREG